MPTEEAIFSELTRYAIQQGPVSLEGYVFSAKDKSEATTACERTPLSKTCTNDLVIVAKPKN